MAAPTLSICIRRRVRRGWGVAAGCRLAHALGPMFGWRIAAAAGDLLCRVTAIDTSVDDGRTWSHETRPRLKYTREA